MVDLSIYAGNNRKNPSVATTGTLGIKLAGDTGTLVNGESYKIGTIPAGSLVKSVDVIVTTAFNGTASAVDIGTTVAGSDLGNDLSLLTTGVVAGTAGTYFAASTPIYATVADGGTVGDCKVVVQFIETDTTLAEFTA